MGANAIGANGDHRIGIVSTRLSGTDGVSLEAAKWTVVLERLGYSCFYLAGELDRPPERSRLTPEAAYSHPDIDAINTVAFRAVGTSPRPPTPST
jgi:hypothetical protein